MDTTLSYHLMHPGDPSLPGDPNAAFYLDGTYHLHYILKHPWQEGESFSFVHVTSPDMLHWTWQPTQLQPALTGHGMFSGTGFITKQGLPAVIYHGQGSGFNQIAGAKDRQISAWDKPYAVQVFTPDGEPATINHWDPDCFMIGDSYYAISGGREQPLLKSQDLKHWTLIGDFMHHDMPDVAIGEDISCPNFFPLGDKWVLLCISHPLGCRYYIGEWDADAEQFIPEQHHRMNWRRDDQGVYGCFVRTDVFAPESVLTADGRRVMWAWLTSIGEDNAYLNTTIQSLPRELSLADDGTLRIKPLQELEGQRSDHVITTGITLDHPVLDFTSPVPPRTAPELQRLIELPDDACEVRIIIPRKEAMRKLFGYVLFANEAGEGLPILFRPDSGTLRVGTMEAPFDINTLPEDEDIELRIFVDKYLVEVFANDRQAVVAAFADYPGKLHLDGFTVGAATGIKTLELWRITPTNQGFLEAMESRVWEPKQD